MSLTHKKLYLILLALTIIAGLMLAREIRNFRAITTSATNEALIAETSTPLPFSSEDKPLGYVAAPLTIVEYQDLGLASGRRIHRELSNFVRQHPADVRLFFKHAPSANLILSDGIMAHKAAYCASLQRQTSSAEPLIWDFLDALIAGDYSLRESGLQKAAADAKLNISLWSACLASDNTTKAIKKDYDEAFALQMGAPPLIFINNKQLNTKLDINLSDLLSSLIAK